MFSSLANSRFLILFLFLVCLFTRFFKLDWGDGNYFHPDENNMASAISRLSPESLDPQFYAYGQFPLYLAYFPLRALGIPNTFSNSIMALRIISAASAFLAVVFVYLIGSRLITLAKYRPILLLLAIFHPGLIQLAHFGTTESLLILVYALVIYLAILFHQTFSLKYLIIAAIVTGLGLATKITALALAGPFFLILFIKFLKGPHRLAMVFLSVVFVLISLQVFIIASPYNLISNKDFLSTLRYETSVATGSTKVFYTSQFYGTTPYLFQLRKVFPYSNGLPTYILSVLGYVFALWYIVKTKGSKSLKTQNTRLYLLLITFSSLVFFLYNGQLYTKWTRFVSPLFILAPLYVSFFLSFLSPKKLTAVIALIVLLSLIPGLWFFRLYLAPDIRLTASSWIVDTLSPHSLVLSEAGNVINIPLLPSSLNVRNFDFYNLDHDPQLQSELPFLVYQSDYILVPSRRIFKNQQSAAYPYSNQYYRQLFSGSLGYQLVNQFSLNTDLLLNSENAEETWSVFDHPTIRVYQKVEKHPLEYYQQALRPILSNEN
jgi:hypothetical protein